MIILEPQKSLARPVRLAGIGLHSGLPAGVTLLPAPSDHGLLFRRRDVTDRDNVVPALYDHVNDTTLSTNLVNGAGVCVRTVEHLMAALAGLHIDNLMMEVDGPEVPILDGSARDFVEAILAAGIVDQRPPRAVIKVLRHVRVEAGESWARLLPDDDGLTVEMAIDFPSAAIGRQHGVYALDRHRFAAELADARTFGLRDDVEHLRARGLVLGGSLDNAVVVDGDRILNPEGLRSPDELVRHKALDALGDLYLAGAPLLARFVGHRSGHALNNRLLRALLADRTAWTTVAAIEEVDGSEGPRWLVGSAAAAP